MQRPSFESLFRLSPNAYVLLDRELRILDANEAYLRLTGRALDEIRGHRLHEAFPADPASPDSTRVDELLDSFERVLSRRTVDTLPVIRYSIRRDLPEGTLYEDRYWSATHTPLLDERGDVSAILQHTVDITELQAMKQAMHQAGVGEQPLQQIEEGLLSRARLLQDEGKHLRRLFAQAPGFVCFLRGPEHVFELVNEAYQQLTGFRQLIGKRVREGMPEVEGQVFLDLLDDVYRTGRPYVGRRMRLMVQQQAGQQLQEVFVDFVYQPIFDEQGQVIGIFVQGHDVSEQVRSQQQLAAYQEHLEALVEERTRELRKSEAERRTAEAALLQAQKLEAVGKLTGGIAHDFNNMLQVIGGNLQLLRRSLTGDETALRRLDSAVGGVDKGARMASQLLAFASRQRLQPQAVRLDELVERLLELLDSSLGQRIEVRLDMADSLWPVFADVGNLEAMLLNLAVNGRDAMEGQGCLTIRLENCVLSPEAARAHPGIEPGDFVTLDVRDEGSGMTPEVQARAFEPFFTTKRHLNASGLGLSMVYGFVRQSGGFITLTSEPGQGTSVCVHLPRYRDEVAPPLADRNERSEAKPQASITQNTVTEMAMDVGSAGLKVLFVEDDPTLRMLTGEVIAELGHEVTLSESAEEALSRLDDQAFDVLFTDVGLVGMSGIDLVRQAKARYPRLAVVIASGYIVEAEQVGVDSLQTMLKPYDINRVRDVLNAIAQTRRGN